MMDKFMKWIDKYLMPVATKMAQNRYLTAIKDGFVYAMPFIIVGSIILVVVNLPLTNPDVGIYSEWYTNLMNNYKASIVQPFYVSMGMMSVFVAFGIGASLASQYGLSMITGGFLSMFSFFLTSARLEWAPMVESDYMQNTFHQSGGWMPIMDARYLDAKGLFTAIIFGILSIEIYKFLVNKNFTVKLPDSVPPAIVKSFELLIPIVVVILLFQPLGLLAESTGQFIPAFIQGLFAPLVTASDSLPAILLVLLVAHVLWFAGIHGTNVTVAAVNAIILTNLSANQAALQAGEALPHIWAGGFLDAFVYLGGSGATLGLAIAMSMSKNERLKAIGKISVVPGLFNINEPVIFGAPIVGNPILFIPFLCVPMINATIAWFAVKTGIVARIVALVPWTTPGPVAALLATNFNIAALILSLGLLVLSSVIYIPFLRAYENQLEQEQVASDATVTDGETVEA